jgi:hypothetical protein
MRQPGLGKLEWVKEDALKKEKDAKKAEKDEGAVSKSKGEKKGGKKKNE